MVSQECPKIDLAKLVLKVGVYHKILGTGKIIEINGAKIRESLNEGNKLIVIPYMVENEFPKIGSNWIERIRKSVYLEKEIMMKMEWSKIMKANRLGCPSDDKEYGFDRTVFQGDFDRIIFSPSFRRLNGKTQVFPFPETDVIHTRLTHSLEAASVGRSLGTMVGNTILANDQNYESCDFGAIVSAACLAHDIGNPPLGHSGEAAISEFFKSDDGKRVLEKLSDTEKLEFENFDGNAMGLHILTCSDFKKTNVKGGLGLTYATLGSFVKYPRTFDNHGCNTQLISEKKPGILMSDLENYKVIAEELGIPLKEGVENGSGYKWYRHPLAFLTEAADDICYNIMDLEDGYKHGLVSYEESHRLLFEVCEMGPDILKIEINLKNIISEREKIGYLRSKAINSLIHQTAEVFSENMEGILSGQFEKALCEIIKSNETMKKIKDVSVDKIYSYKAVLQIEAAGFKVLPGLLKAFLFALIEPNKESSKKIMRLCGDTVKKYADEPYESILAVTTYVAGMTDSFAVDTYRNLQGIDLPNH